MTKGYFWIASCLCYSCCLKLPPSYWCLQVTFDICLVLYHYLLTAASKGQVPCLIWNTRMSLKVGSSSDKYLKEALGRPVCCLPPIWWGATLIPVAKICPAHKRVACLLRSLAGAARENSANLQSTQWDLGKCCKVMCNSGTLHCSRIQKSSIESRCIGLSCGVAFWCLTCLWEGIQEDFQLCDIRVTWSRGNWAVSMVWEL